MKLAAIILLTISSSATAGQCLTYQGDVTLRGILSKHTFPEQPNYESIAKGDAAATYFFISPRRPLCVASGDQNNNELAESRVKSVQLVFAPGEIAYKSLRPHLGKKVECKGSLYHAISGHHHTSVLLWHARCHA
jgi:hypothetical protein